MPRSSRGLGRRSFKPVTRVQIPYAAPGACPFGQALFLFASKVTGERMPHQSSRAQARFLIATVLYAGALSGREIPPQSFGQLPLGGGAEYRIVIFGLVCSVAAPQAAGIAGCVSQNPPSMPHRTHCPFCGIAGCVSQNPPSPLGRGTGGGALFYRQRCRLRGQRCGPADNPLSRCATAPPGRGSGFFWFSNVPFTLA